MRIISKKTLYQGPVRPLKLSNFCRSSQNLAPSATRAPPQAHRHEERRALSATCNGLRQVSCAISLSPRKQACGGLCTRNNAPTMHDHQLRPPCSMSIKWTNAEKPAATFTCINMSRTEPSKSSTRSLPWLVIRPGPRPKTRCS